MTTLQFHFQPILGASLLYINTALTPATFSHDAQTPRSHALVCASIPLLNNISVNLTNYGGLGTFQESQRGSLAGLSVYLLLNMNLLHLTTRSTNQCSKVFTIKSDVIADGGAEPCGNVGKALSQSTQTATHPLPTVTVAANDAGAAKPVSVSPLFSFWGPPANMPPFSRNWRRTVVGSGSVTVRRQTGRGRVKDRRRCRRRSPATPPHPRPSAKATASNISAFLLGVVFVSTTLRPAITEL